MSLTNLDMKVSILDEYKIPYYIQNTKGRKLTVKYDRNGKLKILKPYRYPKDELIKFIEKNIDWIINHYDKSQPLSRNYQDGEEYLLLGKKYITKYFINKHEEVIKKDNELLIYCNSLDRAKILLDRYRYEVSELVFNELLNYSFNKMKDILTKYPKLTIKKYKSKWGLCYPNKCEIVLNISLIHTPVHLIEYVICHELTHLVHPDHSKDFHNTLKKYVVNEKERKKELSKYKTEYN